MATASDGLDPEIRLYNPAGQLVCSAYYYSPGATSFDDCSLPVTGTYTLLANDYGLNDTGSYSLHLSHMGCNLTCAASVPAEGNVSTAVSFGTVSPPPSCGTPISYRWDFGDGMTSIAQNPSHAYATEGTFHFVRSLGPRRH
jgi:microbial collagenase